MLKDRILDMTKGYVLLEYKWVLLMKFIALCSIVTVFLMLTGGAPSPANRADDAPSMPVNAPAIDARKSFKPVILRWMREKSEMPEQVLSTIYDAAAINNNPDIIIAIMLVESNFNPVAKSKKGAMGLMGIRPKVWMEELRVQGLVKEKRDLYAIPSNVAAGAYIFEKYLAKTNNIEKALHEYVGGDPYYAGKVMQALGELYLARSLGNNKITRSNWQEGFPARS